MCPHDVEDHKPSPELLSRVDHLVYATGEIYRGIAANRPYLLELEWALLAHELSLVPWLTSSIGGIGFHD
jgi:hypothetical protein